MANKCNQTDELIAYLELRLEADGSRLREAVMIEDLVASLAKLKGSSGYKNEAGVGDKDDSTLDHVP